MRVRIAFSKTEAMRFTSHLDLHRTWERTLRRAELPLAYSQGFKPHPRINLGCALPLGFTSQAELVDIHLENEIPIEILLDRLKRASPPGIEIHTIECVPLSHPTLQAQILAADYELTLLQPIPGIDARLAELLAATELPRQRREKQYDLRPLILDLRRNPDDNEGSQRLYARLAAREGATGRPEEVILILGGNPQTTRIHRTRLIFSET